MNISGNDNKRIEYTVRVLLCIAVVLVGRLFFLQIIDKSDSVNLIASSGEGECQLYELTDTGRYLSRQL